MLLRDVFYGVRRFDDFAENLGISRNTLTRKLRHLVDEGILRRERYQDDPPRYEYRLTHKGIELFDVIVVLMRWGDTWTDERKKGPPVILTDRTTGLQLQPVLVDECTGQRIDPRRTTPVPGPGAPRTPRSRR